MRPSFRSWFIAFCPLNYLKIAFLIKYNEFVTAAKHVFIQVHNNILVFNFMGEN